MTVLRQIVTLGAAIAFSGAAVSAHGQAITDPTKPPPATPPTPANGAQPAAAQGPAPAAPGAPASTGPSPFTFTAAYTADLLSDVAGGAARGSGYVHLIKLSAAYDGGASGHDGLTGLISVAHLSGSTFTTRRVGGIQSISASETDTQALRLYEAWLQQDVFDGKGAIKAGLIDLNTTFDVQETAALFLNASHGIGPDLGDTGLNGPSDYPNPALAITSFYRPSEDWTVQLGLFDGVAGNPAHHGDFVGVKLDGALLIGQVEKRFGDTARVELGAWTYTGRFPSLDSFYPGGSARAVAGDRGLYALIEGKLLAKPDQEDGGLNGWVRVGRANGDINQTDSYLGAGLVYTGPFEGRDKDEAGVAFARAGLGEGARYVGMLAGRRIGSAETAFEATYRYAATDWLNIQPDLQYVINPHGDRDIADAIVVGMRFAFTYTR